MLYSKEEILDFLPHRAPFLFVDEILSVNFDNCDTSQFKDNELFESKFCVGAKVEGTFVVDEKLEILSGHFPGNPIFPGVTQVEMMGQICPFVFKKAYESCIERFDILVHLLGIDKARFKSSVIPTKKIFILGELIKARGDFQTFQCELKDEQGKLISSAELFARITYKEKEV